MRKKRIEKEKELELIEELKKNKLPFDMIVYEILSFYEADTRALGIRHSLDDPLITQTIKWTYVDQEYDYIIANFQDQWGHIGQSSIKKQTKRRIKGLYGYFSSDPYRKCFLIFRSILIDCKGAGPHNVVQIKGLCSLRIVQSENMYLINGVENLYLEGFQQNTIFTRSMTRIRILKIQNLQQISCIKGLPNIEKLTVIDCRHVTQIHNLQNLKMLKIWLFGYPSRQKKVKSDWTEVKTLIKISNLPKLKELSTHSELIDQEYAIKIVYMSEKIENRICLKVINYQENRYFCDFKTRKLNFVC